MRGKGKEGKNGTQKSRKGVILVEITNTALLIGGGGGQSFREKPKDRLNNEERGINKLSSFAYLLTLV